MQTIRIHSVGFRQLFIMYHVSAGIGFLLLILFFCQSAFDIDAQLFFLIAGILMIVLPYFLAPPEIILDIEEKTFVFRTGFKYSIIEFQHIEELTIYADVMLIRHTKTNQKISIYQDHFKHIPLPNMKKYIENVLNGNTNIDERQFNSIKFKGCLLFG